MKGVTNVVSIAAALARDDIAGDTVPAPLFDPAWEPPVPVAAAC